MRLLRPRWRDFWNKPDGCAKLVFVTGCWVLAYFYIARRYNLVFIARLFYIYIRLVSLYDDDGYNCRVNSSAFGRWFHRAGYFTHVWKLTGFTRRYRRVPRKLKGNENGRSEIRDVPDAYFLSASWFLISGAFSCISTHFCDSCRIGRFTPTI